MLLPSSFPVTELAVMCDEGTFIPPISPPGDSGARLLGWGANPSMQTLSLFITGEKRDLRTAPEESEADPGWQLLFPAPG